MMRTIYQTAEDLKRELDPYFQTIRMSSGQKPEGIAHVVDGMNPEKLPGIVLSYQESSYLAENTIGEIKFRAVIVDRFSAANETRSMSVLSALGTLQRIFPPGGKMMNGVFVLPGESKTCSPCGDHECVYLDLIIRQGI